MEKFKRFLRSVRAFLIQSLRTISYLMPLIGAALLFAVKTNADLILELLPDQIKQNQTIAIPAIFVIVIACTVFNSVEAWNKRKNDNEQDNEQGIGKKLANWVKRYFAIISIIVFIISSFIYFIPKSFLVFPTSQIYSRESSPGVASPSIEELPTEESPVQELPSAIASPPAGELPSVVRPSPTITSSSATPSSQELPKEINTFAFIRVITSAFFLFLILSLLTSEVQDLLAIIFQWRAKHLRKSIEQLLGRGDSIELGLKLVNELYANPLLRALNQESKGLLARFFRRSIYSFDDLYLAIVRTRNIFDRERSGPSYIPSETFAIALLQSLRVEAFSQKVSEITLLQFSEEKLNQLQNVIHDLRNSIGDDYLLDQELSNLRQNLDEIIRSFISQRTTFSGAVSQINTQLSQFIDSTEALLTNDDHYDEIIRRRRSYLQQMPLLQGLEPTVAEVISMMLGQSQPLHPQIEELVATNRDLPQEFKLNLLFLSQQAQLKAQGLDEGVRQLQREIENWFDRAIEQASGVYKRNARGINLLIGFFIAIVLNVDSFHIFSYSISQTKQLALPQISGSENIVTQTAEEEMFLPVGWEKINVNVQRNASNEWGWLSPFKDLLGWLVSGILIAIGALIWHQFLHKFRN